MTITVEAKEVYGNTLVYPYCEKAKAFARIAGTKTLTAETIRVVRKLGYDVFVKQPVLDTVI